MAKLPAMQFYPGDWKRDAGVQSLSYEERGVWFELLLLMFESPERGKLIFRPGTPMPEDAVARALGLDKQKYNQIVSKLLEYGVASMEPETGIIYSRRMVRDAEVSKKRAEAGKMGGNPVLLNQNASKTKAKRKQNPTPSSSYSTSDILTPLTRPREEGFTREQVLEAAKWPDVNISAEKAEEFFNHYDKQGWVFGNGQPVVKLASALRDWKKDKLQTRQKNHGNENNFTCRPNRNAGTYNDNDEPAIF